MARWAVMIDYWATTKRAPPGAGAAVDSPMIVVIDDRR